MLAYCDETGKALAGQLRAGNAGANTAADQIQVAAQALAQIPAEHAETIDVLLRHGSPGIKGRPRQPGPVGDWQRGEGATPQLPRGPTATTAL